MVKAEEQTTITPKEFVESVASVPGKVGNHLQNEWTDIKSYQAESWASAKEQNAKTLAKFKKFLGLGDQIQNILGAGSLAIRIGWGGFLSYQLAIPPKLYFNKNTFFGHNRLTVW